MTKTVAIFGSSQTDRGSTDWHDAFEAGRRCALAGHAVITGGYGGVMEAASAGAASVAGLAIGVIAPPLFNDRVGANPHVSEIIEAGTLPIRLGTLMERADGAIALPGSIGTATELLLAWNHNHIVRRNGGTRLPTTAVGGSWARIATILAETGAETGDVHFAETVENGLNWLLQQPEIQVEDNESL